MNIAHRIREWLADHTRAQYPRQEFIQRDGSARPLRWKYQMPLLVRFNLALVAIFCIIVFGTLAIGFAYVIGVFVWAVWTST